jgi:hypothetical protein
VAVITRLFRPAAGARPLAVLPYAALQPCPAKAHPGKSAPSTAKEEISIFLHGVRRHRHDQSFPRGGAGAGVRAEPTRWCRSATSACGRSRWGHRFLTASGPSGHGATEGAGRLTVGTLMAFYAYLGMLYQPIKRLTELNLILANSIAAMDRIFEVFDTFSSPGTRRRRACPACAARSSSNGSASSMTAGSRCWKNSR